MKFGVDKCAFVQVEKGKLIQNPEPLIINDLIIKLPPADDSYTYLGIDENITYDGSSPFSRIKPFIVYVVKRKRLSFEKTDNFET